MVKSRLRAEVRRRRRAMDAAERHRESAELCTALDTTLTGARVVAGYSATGTEPDPSAALERAHAAGTQVILPVCRPNFQLGWVTWHPDIELRPSALAPVNEPVGPVAEAIAAAAADVILLPATSVDRSGTRLGQGGGYYDRLIAEVRRQGSAAQLIAVVYEHELLPAGSLPRELTDQPVDAVATMSGLTWL
ncbi:5-formyltetrahydrofolate cyclo-ligase [Zhihengliuella flava]|uniref:5-formyltetrahydrofolate cyclo-ligase n=1 Tax=Zhihengliuella flava TaxID=1285193 RepID=A0A931DER5_9MICC|nr:5-formyltetrahydrofolate cyclo-ligase [Zhihengliuella flava]MBG6085485.1 5-formyltetrahydrofolate cyclo-ligase [Zhihengliuella flava]